jgi:polysaccharide export outer membrane protein
MDASWMMVDTGAIAATLVHFVWQGFVVGAAAATLVWVARPRTAQARYAIYCATLAALAACPVATLALVGGRVGDASSPFALSASEVESTASVVVQSSPYAPQRVGAAEWSIGDSVDHAARWLESQRALILAGWSLGVGCSLLRVAAGGVHVWRIARRGRPLPVELQAAVERFSERMKFRRLPAVRVVDEISQAVAVGVVRPMVLLPAAWVTGVGGEMLEAVIAHELAHLRRWDLLVNLLQRVVESALFFHPVVWWCSRRIRAEREMCCDEAAVAALGDRVAYAKALSHLAEHVALACEPAWALGIGGSKMMLFERIRNVLGLGATGHGRWYGPSCAVIGEAVTAAASVTEPQGRGENSDSEAQTKRFMAGEDVNSNADVTGVIENAPSEHKKVLLPSYTIEPPDILVIEVAQVAPKARYHLQRFDEVQIIAEPPEANLAARGFFVDDAGCVDLGPKYGKVEVRGMDTDEAAAAVRTVIEKSYPGAAVSLTVVQGKPLQPIVGEHLVAPDGYVNLGRYGQVLVAGLTVGQAKKKIEEHLSATLDSPDVALSVFAYNSKVYYVIQQGRENGDIVTRLPIAGNETVLDALSQVSGLDGMRDKHVWIARPKPDGAATDRILLVDWQGITRGAATATNYQLLPGDRVFVAKGSPVFRPVGP